MADDQQDGSVLAAAMEQSGDRIGEAVEDRDNEGSHTVENLFAETRQEYPHGIRKMEFADLELKEIIGQGGFGAVFRANLKTEGREVAMKQVPYGDGHAEEEVRIMSELKHPNIITLYGTVTMHPRLYIVMELAEGGALYSHIQHNRGKPNMEMSLHWTVDIAQGMSYLHEKEIAHRNLKSHSVLLTSTLSAKIGSFGCLRQLDHTTRATMTGTVAWMAPEVINGEAYSKRCDLFSYGTVLWELMTHEVPFEGQPVFQIMIAIAEGNMPAIPAAVAGYLSKLIQLCWSNNPKERPPFLEIVDILKPHLRAKDVLAVLERRNSMIEFGDVQFETDTKGEKKSIGCGTFGTVFKGQWNEKTVAIKKVEHDKSVAREISIFELKHHPNIITLHGAALRGDSLYIVMELAECSLYEHIQKHKGKPDMELSLHWAAEVAEGMRYLHDNDIGHRDLKSHNVLLTVVEGVKVAKICDFGTARKLDRKAMATWVGTPASMAPEVIKAVPYSKRCDLFSYGIVLWELVTHKVPFEGFEGGSILFHIGSGKTQELLPIPAETAVYLSSLIRRCWEMDPDERLSFDGILTVLDKKQMIQVHAIKFANLVLGEKIGLGGFGEVLKGHWNDKAVAIKQMPYDEGIAKEISIMSELKHPNIITLYGTVSKDPNLYIVMELAQCSLSEHIKDHKGKPDIETSLCWAVEVAKGMEYLHGKGIVHRDLKSRNVLLTIKVMVAKICDFGIARQLDHATEGTIVDTFQWMAPEVIKAKTYSEKCDLFSYGTLLWELVTHEVPFEDLHGVPFQIQVAIVKGNMPAIPAAVEGYLSELIEQCWNMDPDERPPFGEILKILKPHVIEKPAEACDGEEEEIKTDSKPRLEHFQLLPCRDKAAIRVAAEIKDNWQKVAKKLEITADMEKEIKQQSSTPEQQALAMLRRWREGGNECSEQATWDTLIDALMGSGFKPLAKRLTRRTVE